jgi:hypothetical protein
LQYIVVHGKELCCTFYCNVLSKFEDVLYKKNGLAMKPLSIWSGMLTDITLESGEATICMQ